MTKRKIDKRIFVYYKNGDVDDICVDGRAQTWSVDGGLFTVDDCDDNLAFIGDMDEIKCIKVVDFDEAENSPKNKKGLIDSDLRTSAAIMREEYRNNPEFRQSVYASMESAFWNCPDHDNALKAAIDRLFDYETDSNN